MPDEGIWLLVDKDCITFVVTWSRISSTTKRESDAFTKGSENKSHEQHEMHAGRQRRVNLVKGQDVPAASYYLNMPTPLHNLYDLILYNVRGIAHRGAYQCDLDWDRRSGLNRSYGRDSEIGLGIVP